jgi:hypothetical protein
MIIVAKYATKEFAMEFIPYRLLRNEPAALRHKLADQGELVVTVDGKPFAVMIDLAGAENVEEILLMVTRLRAQMALRSVRSKARRDGLDNMTGEQIDGVIKEVRSVRGN